ncbi:MAG: response regulator [Candidatus Desantisbacteria bacterium]
MKKILVIDDELHIRKIIEIKLKGAGYEIFTAEDGEEGLRKASELLPDLIILDLLMPKMDGFELCQTLKEKDATRNIPIVALTALAQKSEIEKARQAGADKVLTKPFSPRDLLSEVEEIMK